MKTVQIRSRMERGKKLTLIAIRYPDGNMTAHGKKFGDQLSDALRMRYHSYCSENNTSDLNLWPDVGEIGNVGHDLSTMGS
jgi:hypothetical protein